MLPKTAEYALARPCAWVAIRSTPSRRTNWLNRRRSPDVICTRCCRISSKRSWRRSQPGPGGGYARARSPEKITILDVVNAVAELERIRHCPLGLSSHKRLCPLHAELDRVYAATEAALSRVTIAQLLQSTSTIVPLCEVSG